MSFVIFNQNFTSQASHSTVTSGSPGVTGDGINWPYDNNGTSPDPSQFQIDWNSPNAVQQAEQAYERLVAWLQNNPGCYNGDIMLLQMTIDMGQHIKNLSPTEQQQLTKFLSNQLTGQSGSMLLQMIMGMAAEGAAVSQSSLNQGIASATQFLSQIGNALSALQGLGQPFENLYFDALNAQSGIANWCKQNWKTFTDPQTGAQSSCWVDSNGVPVTSFSQFASEAAFQIGLYLVPSPANSNVGLTIDAYYQAEIEQLVSQFKDNPWALLVALMNLINQRDTDNGMAVNGYGNNLNTIQQANTLVQNMLGDLSGATPNAADFFAKLQQLETLVDQDPALQSLISQLQSDVGTINNQVIPGMDSKNNPLTYNWSVTAGYYNIPSVDTYNGKAGLWVTYNGKRTFFPAGECYLSGGTMSVSGSDIPKGMSIGQFVGMGGASVVGQVMGDWSSTVMSNFENGVTGIQTLLNGASPAIQQQIQNTTQTMQAEENFEKEAFDSVVNVNQQIMKLIQQVMG